MVQLSSSDNPSPNRRDPFCKRNLPVQVGEEPPLNVETKSGLELKICVNTYKIFFVDNTEDYFRRKKPNGNTSEAILANSNLETRKRRFTDWLESDNGWKRGMTSSEGDELVKHYNDWIRGNQSG